MSQSARALLLALGGLVCAFLAGLLTPGGLEPWMKGALIGLFVASISMAIGTNRAFAWPVLPLILGYGLMLPVVASLGTQFGVAQ